MSAAAGPAVSLVASAALTGACLLVMILVWRRRFGAPPALPAITGVLVQLVLSAVLLVACYVEFARGTGDAFAKMRALALVGAVGFFLWKAQSFTRRRLEPAHGGASGRANAHLLFLCFFAVTLCAVVVALGVTLASSP